MTWTKELDEAAILATKTGHWHVVLFYLLCGLAAIPTSFLVFSQVTLSSFYFMIIIITILQQVSKLIWCSSACFSSLLFIISVFFWVINHQMTPLALDERKTVLDSYWVTHSVSLVVFWVSARLNLPTTSYFEE